MLWQFHWQYKNGKTVMKAQREIKKGTSFREWQCIVMSIREQYPLPEDTVWLACNETSPYFVEEKVT